MATHPTRRRYLTAATALACLAAGCGGDGGDGGDGAPGPDDYPLIDQWLTETEIGGADETYDGTFTDRRGQDTVTVDVGTEGNGGTSRTRPRRWSSRPARKSGGTGPARGTRTTSKRSPRSNSGSRTTSSVPAKPRRVRSQVHAHDGPGRYRAVSL
ncbi:hypothetical protein ACFQL1_22990 [Halomicroarcula sp. GCM10025709]|uniref:hypothetical protein n=1 Tax=Halomicroarcula sp. GCM10025709 TaxID=3252669 RepID=UPI003606FD67